MHTWLVSRSASIGCQYCSQVARNTFFMEEDAGRARVFQQAGDSPEVIAEAIDTCPVNCINYVDFDDLVVLESEREGFTVNQRQAGMRHGDSYGISAPETKAKLGSGSLTCCNNCPSKGCKECPMFGVGQNPVYLARLEERQLKREESGEAEAERIDTERALKVGALFEECELPPPEVAGTASAGSSARTAEIDIVIPGGYKPGEEFCIPFDSSDEAAPVEIECPSYLFAGDSLPFETPDGDRVQIDVPEWVVPGESFFAAVDADGEWQPCTPEQMEQRAATAAAAAAAICVAVPEGCAPGDTITVSVPCATATAGGGGTAAIEADVADATKEVVDAVDESDVNRALDALYGGGYAEPDFDLDL